MKVLHVAAEIAGQPALLCRGLRQLGVDARSLAFGETWHRYPSDITIQGGGALGLVRRLRALLEHGPRLDILHVHFGTSFLPRMLDVPWLHRRGTRIVFHYHGCDIRPRASTLAAHAVSACSECPVYCSEQRQARLRRLADACGALTIVSTPDLLEAAPGAVHLPVTIDVETWTRVREQSSAAPGWVVLHAPSDPEIKGSRHVEAAVAALGARHADVRLLQVRGVPAAEARELYGQATVAVDQLHMGWHGLFAVEAMILGKPCLVYIRPELADYRPRPPIVATDRERLQADLERLYDAPGEVEELTAAGIEYASRVHGLEPVATRLKQLYEERVLAA